MVGTVKQQIYIKAIPNGMKMRITALNLLPPDPPKEWRATLYNKSGTERIAPFDFDPSVDHGHLGEVKMYGAHAFPSNSLGARLEILWELTGAATLNAEGGVDMATVPEDAAVHPALKPADAERDDAAPTLDVSSPDIWATKLDALPAMSQAKDENARNGRFIVETTKWGLVERPDYCSVLYQVGSETPQRVISKIAATIIDMPEDALFVVGANVDTQKIGINATQDTNVANTLASYLMEGIFYAHEKAVGWVIGLFW